ncbi:MAG: tetratricopeptide repeat protein [Magnetococcales bacterium]|nr:tetratricopeptide repeat protein [Magnetococcales bacterium]
MSVVNRALQKIRRDKQNAAATPGSPKHTVGAVVGSVGQPRWREYVSKYAGKVLALLLVVTTAGIGWWFLRDDKDRAALLAGNDNKSVGSAGEQAATATATATVVETKAVETKPADAVAATTATEAVQQPAKPATQKKIVRLTAEELFARYEQQHGQKGSVPAAPAAAAVTPSSAAPAAATASATTAAVVPVVSSAAVVAPTKAATVSSAVGATLAPASMASMMGGPVTKGDQGPRVVTQMATKSEQLAQLGDERQQAHVSVRMVRVSKLVRDIHQAITGRQKEAVERGLQELEAIRGEQDAFVLNLWAYWFLVQEDYDHAGAVLRRVLSKRANDLEASVNMVVLEVKTKQFEAARSRLAAMLELYPTDERLRHLQQSLP